MSQSPALLAAVEYPSAKLLPKLTALLPAARKLLRTANARQLTFYLRALGAQRSEGAVKTLTDLLATEGLSEPRRRTLRDVALKVLSPYAGEALDPLLTKLRAASGR